MGYLLCTDEFSIHQYIPKTGFSCIHLVKFIQNNKYNIYRNYYSLKEHQKDFSCIRESRNTRFFIYYVQFCFLGSSGKIILKNTLLVQEQYRLAMSTVSPGLFLWNILTKIFIIDYKACDCNRMQKCFMAHEKNSAGSVQHR